MSNRTFRPWAIKRRISYGVGFAAVWGLVGVFLYFVYGYAPPSCFDRQQNGTETGVDCGGECVRICAAEVLPPQVVWAESFAIIEGQYNAVAYVENQNQTAATPELAYTFTLYNGEEVVAERSGTTVLPPNSVYPIFEGRIYADTAAEVTNTELVLTPATEWIPAAIGRDQFRTVDINLTNADQRPRLDVEIENTKLTAAENVEVVATVFSADGEPVTASQTFIEQIEPRSIENIVFTWPNSIAKTVKSCIIPTDVTLAIDLSGSMNNDGANPPQPLTDALAAASQFITTLQEQDQVAVTTFASTATTTKLLTNQHQSVAEAVRELSISPAAERGYTNTVAALTAAQAELNSARHNPDARRVLVLLTDGLPTAPGDTEVIVAETETLAATLNEEGVEVYAIGLGEAVDQEFIRTIASREANAYLAPTGADLMGIYAAVTSSLCEVGPTKIDVIAKTKTNFAPLR